MQKTALVTGAAAGIGRACALRLAREGAKVGVLDLNLDAAQHVADEIKAEGGEATALTANVADRAQMSAAMTQLREAFGPITVLVNNAALCEFASFEDITDADWDRTYAVNVRGLFAAVQLVFPDMKAAQWGRVINISSSSAQTGSAGHIHYSSSKGAVISMTRSLAHELGPHGITVNNIAPFSVMGTIMSEANKHLFPIPIEELANFIPVRRTGEPNDIANACAWLASEDSGYVSGQTIGVNGGRVPS